MRFRSILTALGLNAVPAFGWFAGNWSIATILVLYWMETLVGTVFVAARILLHRRVRPSKGHWNYQAQQKPAPPNGARSSYLVAFLVPAGVFTMAHGIFLAALGFMAIKNHLNVDVTIKPDNFIAGLGAVLMFQTGDFLLDLASLKIRPFAWLERLGQVTLGRVIVVHLTIIGGMAAIMFTGVNRHFFGVFVFLKTMLQCSLVLPQWSPKTPPAWLSNAMDHIGSSKHKNESFVQFWKQTDDQEKARLARNEKAPGA